MLIQLPDQCVYDDDGDVDDADDGAEIETLDMLFFSVVHAM